MYFDQLLDFPILLLLFLHTLLLCHILVFRCWIFSIPSGCQTVWIQIRPDILLGLIWVQTVCKGYQQITKVAPSEQRVKYNFNNLLILLSKLIVPRLFEEKRRDIVFGIPSFRPSVLPSVLPSFRPSVLPSFRPPNIVGTLCAQLLLQFYADSFETLQMF